MDFSKELNEALGANMDKTPKTETPIQETKRDKYAQVQNALQEVLKIDTNNTEARMALEWVTKKIDEMTKKEVEEKVKLEEAKKKAEEERVYMEAESKRRDTEVNRLVNKLSQCIDFQSLYALEEDLNRVGMTIQTTANNRMILCKLMEGRPVANNVIEDYVFVGSLETATRELTDRAVNKICDFVRMNAGNADAVKNVARVWRNGLKIYESSINIMNEDVNEVAGDLLCD